MSKLHVNISEIRNVSTSLRMMNNQVIYAKEEIDRVRRNTDPKIKARNNIGAGLDGLHESLEYIQRNVLNLVNFIDEAMDRYERCEGNIEKEGQAIINSYQGLMVALEQLSSVIPMTAVMSKNEEMFLKYGDSEVSSETEEAEDKTIVEEAEDELDKGKKAVEGLIDKAEKGAEEEGEKIESFVKNEFENFEREVEGAEKEIEKTAKNKNVEEMIKAVDIGETVGREVLSMEGINLPDLEPAKESQIKKDEDMDDIIDWCKNIGSEDSTEKIKEMWDNLRNHNSELAGRLASGIRFDIELVKPVYELTENPEGTLKKYEGALKNIVLLLNPKAGEKLRENLFNSMKSDIQTRFINGDKYTRSEYINDLELNIGTIFFGGGEVGGLSKAEKVEGIVSKTSKAGEIVNDSLKVGRATSRVSKIDGISKDISEISKVEETGKHESILSGVNKEINIEKTDVEANKIGDRIEIGNRGKSEENINTNVERIKKDSRRLEGVGEANTTIDYVKLSEELENKIETDGYKVINTETAEQANKDWADMGFDLPPVAENTNVYNVEAGNFSYSRVYLDGYNYPKSRFILRTEDIQGLSAEEIAQKYALPKVPNKIVTVELPSDTPLEVSIVGPQETWGTLGGDVQYAIKDSTLEDDWFSNIKDLK